MEKFLVIKIPLLPGNHCFAVLKTPLLNPVWCQRMPRFNSTLHLFHNTIKPKQCIKNQAN